MFFIRPRMRHSRSPSARTISPSSCFTTATGDGDVDVGGAAGISSLAASWRGRHLGHRRNRSSYRSSFSS